MNELQARKNLLLSKAALQRLRLRNDAEALKRSFSTPSSVVSTVVGSGAGKALLMGAAMAFLGRSRLKGVAGGALTVISILKTVMGIVARFRGGRT